MRKRGLLVGVVSAVAAVVGATGLVSTADAVHVVCGQVITQNTTLDTNLIGCTNNGIVIGADNITLNLAGRTVSGTGVPGDGAGILAVGRTGVTIAGGVVSGFDGGVVIQGGARNTVRQVVVQDNVGRINDPVLPNTPYADGILILDSSNNQVLNNQALRNGPLSGIGLRGNSDNNLVQGNLSESNRALLSGPSPESSLVDDMGYRLDGIGERLPNFNLLQFNNARNNGQDGFSLFTGANDNRLVGNISTSNGFDGPEHFRGSGIKMHHDTRRTYVTG
ncbi:MAG: right-handed parallel beta-helix repeat-containing protein, partial [Acidimicrobiales bacterium]